ncbi:MAG: rod shape-determining protein MreC [Solirubrobacteraceae bacterium]|nr:rod shape-determining protein MreC [Solirubrobacteraceae bacterium]
MLLALIIGLIAALSATVKPIGDGTHRALKPLRDLASNFQARKERDRLQTVHDDLERQLAALQTQAADNTQFKNLVDLNQALGLARYQPLQAEVSGRAPGLLPTVVRIDVGTSAGVRIGQPVLGGDGLVGRVTGAGPAYALVRLITAPDFATGVLVSSARIRATAIASPNRPGELELTLVQSQRLLTGDQIVTEGTTSARERSFYPEGIPVGHISSIDTSSGQLSARVRVQPAADLADVDRVEVLTGPGV